MQNGNFKESKYKRKDFKITIFSKVNKLKKNTIILKLFLNVGKVKKKKFSLSFPHKRKKLKLFFINEKNSDKKEKNLSLSSWKLGKHH